MPYDDFMKLFVSALICYENGNAGIYSEQLHTFVPSELKLPTTDPGYEVATAQENLVFYTVEISADIDLAKQVFFASVC